MPSALILLGSTGSIGTQTLQVIEGLSPAPVVLGLSAGKNLAKLSSQIDRYRPGAVCIQDVDQVESLKEMLAGSGFRGEVFAGPQGLIDLLDHAIESARALDDNPPAVVVGLSGIAGLAPTLHALKRGCRVLTANKETFVAGGVLVAPYLSQIIPLDSEHNAVMQCMHGHPRDHIAGLTLTASGGPFLNTPPGQLKHVTPAEALNHPTWSMGPKISIDSATLMNKGLEVIEAHWLFSVPYDAIDIAIHPQSVLHGAISFQDGSLLAHLGPTDMRLVIQYGLLMPERGNRPEGVRAMRLAELGTLEFSPPDLNQFPCLALALDAGRWGQAATIVLNAADEVLVRRFLEHQIGFLEIAQGIDRSLEAFRNLPESTRPITCLQEVQTLDAWARDLVTTMTFERQIVSTG